MDTIHEEPRGGECNRCHEHKSGIKVFLLQSNPSLSFGKPENLEVARPPDIKNQIVCKSCLTDEEIAKLLAPVAAFVLEALFLRRMPIHDGVAMARALLAYQCGLDGVFHGAKEKALEALG